MVHIETLSLYYHCSESFSESTGTLTPHESDEMAECEVKSLRLKSLGKRAAGAIFSRMNYDFQG